MDVRLSAAHESRRSSAPDATTVFAAFSASPASSASQNARMAASSRAGGEACADNPTTEPQTARMASNREQFMAQNLTS